MRKRGDLIQFDQHFSASGGRDQEEVDSCTVGAWPGRRVDGLDVKFFFQNFRRAIHILAAKFHLLHAFPKLGQIARNRSGTPWLPRGEHVEQDAIWKMKLKL